jgi:hypothetical protein
VLVSLCEDALFGVLASGAVDPDELKALARRRGPSRSSGSGPTMAHWDTWLVALAAASAPIAPPRFLPMAAAIEEGLTLEGGARGMRALFTTKPSEKDVARVRQVGRFALRVLGAVYASTGSWGEGTKRERAMLIAALGLPDEDQQILLAEVPGLAEAIDYTGPLDARMSRHIVRGAFHAALADGLDPREEGAIEAIARRLFIQPADVHALGNEARAEVEAQRPLGQAAVDAIRFVAADAPEVCDRFATAAAHLGIPAVYRGEALTALQVGGQVTLGKKHQLERKDREAALGLAWLAALASNPTFTRRAELAVRHDAVAMDLGGFESGALVRAILEQLIEPEVVAFVASR